MTPEATSRNPATEATAMPTTSGSDTYSSQCSPRYHQFSPTRHLMMEICKLVFYFIFCGTIKEMSDGLESMHIVYHIPSVLALLTTSQPHDITRDKEGNNEHHVQFHLLHRHPHYTTAHGFNMTPEEQHK